MSAQDKKKRQQVVASLLDVRTVKGARKAALRVKIQPQLARLAEEAPSGSEWLHEIKFDGYRIVACLARGKIRLSTRNGKDWTPKFSTIVASLGLLPVKQALLDGELVHEQPSGVTSFSALTTDLSEGRTEHLVYYIFDLLHLDGYSLFASPLEDRKRTLAALLTLGLTTPIRFSRHTEGNGPAVFAKSCSLGLEGIVSKRRDAPYHPGRSGEWLKVKCAAREEFAIIGWTDPTGSRQGLGALLVGYYDAQGRLHYAGGVGTGFTSAALRDLRARLDKLGLKTPSSERIAAAAPKRSHWVRPELVAEVRFTEWTPEGRLRHPVFLGLREDKKGRDVVIDPAIGTALDRPGNQTAQSVRPRSPTRATGRRGSLF